jgi:hypothetical protein
MLRRSIVEDERVRGGSASDELAEDKASVLRSHLDGGEVYGIACGHHSPCAGRADRAKEGASAAAASASRVAPLVSPRAANRRLS